MAKITDYDALTDPASDDLLIAVDVSDDSMADTGTDKKLTIGDLPGSYQAWQFSVDDPAYGAVGDGKVLGDGHSSSNTTFTSASAGFTSADTGKYIMIHGANGATGGPLITTITYVNSTTVTLGSSAGATVSNCPFVYGTDDTAAINSAVSAAGTYALDNNYYAEVVFGAKIYVLATGPTQATTPVVQNAQIPLPYPNVNGTTRKLVIALTGAGDAGYCQYWENLVPSLAGSALVSMTTAPSTTDATYGVQSVIGGPSDSGGLTGGYANVKAVVKGLSVWCSIWTNQYAYDFGFVTAMRVQQSSANTFAPVGVNESAVEPYQNAITNSTFLASAGGGFRTPVNGNNDDVYMDDVAVEGYECGYRIFDHFTAGRLAAINTDVAVYFNASLGASGTSHALSIQQISAEVYNGGFLTNGGTAQVDILWDAENSGVTYDVSDTSNALRGVFRFRDPANVRYPTVSGGADLKVICDELGPGHWASPPSVPATTVAQQNTAWRDAWVTITSGGAAVTEIDVDGHATGLVLSTSGTVAVRVPSGKNITLTYASTAPTWSWWLD